MTILINKIKNYVISNWPLVVSLCIFFIAYFLLQPLKNYTISDDFYYLIQVKNFLSGHFIKNALIIPSFVLQGFIGAGWGYLFGVSFVSLRILTLIFALISIFVFSLILDNLKLNKKLHFVALLLLIFNPFFLKSVPSFMTEIYFLVFLLFGVLFFLKYIDTASTNSLLISGVFIGLSSMVRQFGLMAFVIFSCVLFYEFLIKKSDLRRIFYFLPGIGLALIGLFWPHYTNPATPQSLGVLALFGSIESILGRVLNINILPYLMFCAAGLLLSYKNNIKAYRIVPIILIGIVIGYFYFEKNVFYMGNSFYLEGIIAKAQTTLRNHIFHNLFSKATIAVFLGMLTVSAIYIIKDKWKQVYTDTKTIFLLLLTLGYFLIAATPMVQYDRYYFYCLIFGILFFTNLLNTSEYNFKLLLIGVLFSTLTTYLLIFDLFTEYGLKYRMYTDLRAMGVTEQIFFNLNYDKYFQIEETGNYDGKFPIRVPSEHKCFLLTYAKSQNTLVKKRFSQMDELYLRYFNKPVPYIEDWGYSRSYLLSMSKKDKVYFEEEYFSPIYNLIGTQMAVRATCSQDVNLLMR